MVWSTRRPAFAAPASLLSLLVVWSTDGSSPVAPALAAVPVPVVVVLNLASAMDRRSVTCISMALDDFYLKHPSYTTRVVLRVSDSRGNLVAAAYAAQELVDKNAQVKAIILPQTSAEVELFNSIAERYNIPILSSSTDAPSSSPPQSRFFVRTAPNISSQVAPISAILEAFAWPAAILLHEDSPYGIAILSSLVHAFRGTCTLRDSVAMPNDATDGYIRTTLFALKNSLTRVYIVHMLPALAARLFHRAMAAGMMSEGYVWITTSGVGNAADNLNSGIIDSMQGVVSLRPHVHATDQVRNFSRRLDLQLQESTANNDTVHDDQSAPVSLLWLYDTAWAAAAAAEVSFQTMQSKTFLDALLVTKFDGLAGRFGLVDGQWQVSAYEIVNIIGKGTRTVGFWTPESGISTTLYPKSTGRELKQILWPGETVTVPIGFGRSESPNRSPLRVGLPMDKNGLIESLKGSKDANNNTQRMTGYCIDVFQAAMAKLHYTYVFTPFDESYERLVNLVHEREVDALVGDVTITASRMKLVAFSMPFADPGWSMIVAEDSNNSMWIFVKPLTVELWITSLAFFFFTGFVVWMIEHRINPRFRGTPWRQFGVLFYFAFSTMVFSHKEKLESNLSKLVVIMWVFVVLILTTSYTANLTSMLTIRQLQPAISDLREEDYVGVQEGSFLEGTLRDMGFDEKRFRRYSSIDEYADALNKGSGNGGVTAIFDEVPYLRLFLSRYCNGYSMVGPIYKSGGFGFAFPMGSTLALDVSRAILELAGEEKLARIEDRWFNRPGSCVGRSDSAYARLGLQRFGGLFLTNAIVGCIAVTIHLCTFAFQERARSELEHPEPAGAGALPWLRAWLRRFDAFRGPRPRGVPVSSGPSTEESNHHEQELAVGATCQQGALRDSRTVDPQDSEENVFPAAASQEIVAPVGGHSIGQSVDEPARVVSM